MKTLVTLIGLIFIVQGGFAQTVGGPMTHKLSCTPPADREGHVLVGVQYEMECTTQALAPHQNLRGCDLIVKPVRPGARGRSIELTMIKQTASRATFINEDVGIKVLFNKRAFSAKISFAEPEGVTSKCKRTE